MEMTEIETEEKKEETEAMQPPENKVKEGNPYSVLQAPTEDIYSETLHPPFSSKDRPEKATAQKLRLYRTACLVLALLSSILLVVVILLLSLKQGEKECVMEQCEIQHVQPSTCKHCPKGWLFSGKSCFFLSRFRLSWDESQSNCSSMGAMLATVNTPEIQGFLTQYGTLMYWIGLRLNGTTWTWTDNTVLQKSFWEDESQVGDCALLAGQMKGNNWQRQICTLHSYYICHLQLA